MIRRIDDDSDPALAPYRDVADHAALVRAGLFVAEGRLVVRRLLEDRRHAPVSVLVTAAAAASLAAVLDERPDLAVYVAPPEVLAAVTGVAFHRGCLALARRSAGDTSIAALLAAPQLLGVEGVTDPDNLGGLFRAGLALGAGGLVLDRTTADPLYRKAIRTSMAATLRVPFVRVDPWPAGLEPFRHAGFCLAALTPAADATPLQAFNANGRAVLWLVGSEGHGLCDETLRTADARVRIPVDPSADSLNVVSAASIALYTTKPPC